MADVAERRAGMNVVGRDARGFIAAGVAPGRQCAATGRAWTGRMARPGASVLALLMVKEP
jgi:hypothetical protein